MSSESPAKSESLLKPYRFKVGQFERMIAAGIFPEGARIELRNGLLAVKNGVPRKRILKTRSGRSLYKLSARQIDAMLTLGILKESTRAELLGGMLIKQMTKYPPHNFATDQLAVLLAAILPHDWIARQEKTVAIGPHWRPEPDIAVVRGPRARYRVADPTQAEVGLVIEVAESSYAEDRRVKWRKYAAAGIPTYWIVNLNARRIEVFSQPQGAGKSANYREEKHFGPEEQVPVVLEGEEIGRIQVSAILPLSGDSTT